MKIAQTTEGIVISHTVKGLNDEGIEINLENYERRGISSVEEARVFAENRLNERGIQEEVEILAAE